MAVDGGRGAPRSPSLAAPEEPGRAEPPHGRRERPSVRHGRLPHCSLSPSSISSSRGHPPHVENTKSRLPPRCRPRRRRRPHPRPRPPPPRCAWRPLTPAASAPWPPPRAPSARCSTFAPSSSHPRTPTALHSLLLTPPHRTYSRSTRLSAAPPSLAPHVSVPQVPRPASSRASGSEQDEREGAPLQLPVRIAEPLHVRGSRAPAWLEQGQLSEQLLLDALHPFPRPVT